MKAQRQPGEAADGAADFIARNFGAGKKQITGRDPEWQDLPSPNDVPRQGAGNISIDRPRFNSSGRQALLQAQGFIEFFLGNLAELY